MRILTQVKVVSFILVGIICLLSGAFFVVLGQINHTYEKVEDAHTLVYTTFERRLSTDEYTLNRSKRAKDQWFKKQQELVTLISEDRHKFVTEKEIRLLDSIDDTLPEVEALFNELVSAFENSNGSIYSDVQINQLATQLMLKAQLGLTAAGQLAQINIKAVDQFMQQLYVLFFVATVFIIATILYGIYVVLRAVKAEEAIQEMKSDFVSLVSHQLKTPVAQIKGYVENMLEGLAGRTTKKQREYLNDMLNVADKNSKLIDDLLNISRIERGMLKVEITQLPLQELLNDVLSPLRNVAKAKGVVLKEDLFNKPVVIDGDSVKTREALRNIVDNAIKFTEAGKSVSVSAKEDAQFAIIAISDEGPGVDSDVQHELFEKNRVWTGKVKASGAGLGLFLSKQFVELTGGTIEFKTEAGRGTTFIIRFRKSKT